MRSRYALLSLLAIGVAAAVPHLAHAAIPYFGPIIPTGWDTCPSSWAGLITVANNIISFLITMAIVFVAPLAIAYAGFLYVLSPTSAGDRGKANSIITNTIIGIVVALAGWLIVDAMLSVLYNPSTVGANWYNLVTGTGSTCLSVASALNQSGGATNGGSVTGVDINGNQVLSFDPNAATTGACSASALQGVDSGLSTANANTFACLAKYESSCGTNLQNDQWANGSSAYGPFQITLASHSALFNIPVCEQAAGVTGPLNCASGFDKNGNPLASQQTVVQNCRNAAADLSCSLAVAEKIEQTEGWTAWTADKRSSSQGQCIQTYQNGGG